MRLDDIRSPGFLTNSHAIRKEVVKAISFAQIQCPESKQEKLTDLIMFFNEAIRICNDELELDDPKTEPEEPAHVANHYTAVLPPPEVPNATKKVNRKGVRAG